MFIPLISIKSPYLNTHGITMKSPFFAGFLTYPLLFLAFFKDDKFREIRLKCFVHWMPSTGTQPHGEMGTFCRKTIGKISGKAHHAARKKSRNSAWTTGWSSKMFLLPKVEWLHATETLWMYGFLTFPLPGPTLFFWWSIPMVHRLFLAKCEQKKKQKDYVRL